MTLFRTHHLKLSTWKIFFALVCINNYLLFNLVESAIFRRIYNAPYDVACRSYCITPTCYEDASLLLRSMDRAVNPCDNFYEFACGNFIRYVQMPESTNMVDVLNIVQSQVSGEVFNEIRKEITETDTDAFKKVKTYYSNCMNEDYIKQEGTKPIFKYLNVIGGWPVLLGYDWDESKFDWAESVYKLRENGLPFSFPVQLMVAPEMKNSTKRILKVMNSNTIVNKLYLEGSNNKYYKNLYKFVTEIAKALGADETDLNELTDMLQFEIELFKIQTTAEEKSEKLIDNLMTVRELSQNYSSIPWLELFNKMLQPSISIDENEVVGVMDIDYLGKVEKLLQITPKRVLANYLAWNLVNNMLKYMPEELQKIELDFINGLMGTNGRMNREAMCSSEIAGIFSIAVSSMYINKYFNNPEIKKSIYDLVQDIKNQMKRNLEKIDWMDEKTRKAALHKLAAMTVNPGYVDELKSAEKVDGYYKDMVIKPGSFLESSLNTSSFLNNKNFADLKKPIDKNEWSSHPSSVMVNAFYAFQNNQIEIPAGILRGIFFKIDRPKYLNYGSIGMIIGHEITHAFDTNGRKYDENGNRENWWQPETEKHFLNKVQCIIDQYNNFTVKEVGRNVNGVLTQGENISDNGGFKAAYHAYTEWVSRNNIYEACLPSLNYSPRQMFWITAASSYCAKQRPEFLEQTMATDGHSPPSARIINSFSNLKEFAEDFKCNVGTPMNPKNKCVVW